MIVVSQHVTNAVQVYDFLKTVWSQAYEYYSIGYFPWWDTSDQRHYIHIGTC